MLVRSFRTAAARGARVLAARAALFALCIGASYCRGDETGAAKFRVRVHCQSIEGRAIPGVLLSGGRNVAVRTDTQGNAALAFEGREGEEVTLRVERLPPGLELADGSELRRVVLKAYAGSDSRGAISDIPHDIPLRNRKDGYIVLVYADQAADLPVVANGAETAQLNSRGAAAFRHEGKPGEELIVSIRTGENPRASRIDPKKTFILPDSDRVLTFHSDLTMAATAPAVQKQNRVKKTAQPMKIQWRTTQPVRR